MATHNPDVYQNLFAALRSEKGALRGTDSFDELDQAIRDMAGVPLEGAGGYEDLCKELRSAGYADSTLAQQLKVTALSEPVYVDESSGRPSYYASELGAAEVYSTDPFADATEWVSDPPVQQQQGGEQTPELYHDAQSGNYYDAQGNWYDQNRNKLSAAPEQPAQPAATSEQTPELYLDETSGRYYDAQGNWYDRDRKKLDTAPAQPAATSEQTPELYHDDKSGMFYDAQGNWYDQNRNKLGTTPEQPAQPVQEQQQAPTTEPKKVGDAEATELATKFLQSEGIDISASLADIDKLLGAGATD